MLGIAPAVVAILAIFTLPSHAASPLAPRSNVLTDEPWHGVTVAPLTPAELDQMVTRELHKIESRTAILTTDAQFLRRVSLDLVGKPPAPQEITDFVADTDPRKRANAIDRLLDSDAYARHRAKYWSDVVSAHFTDRRALVTRPSFELWLTAEFKANRPWDQMVRAMLTAEGALEGPEPDGKNGAAYFLMAHFGQDQAEERAAETARVFLGMQIQCAQCHDHPFDEWKQRQFHELTGYFARLQAPPPQLMMGQFTQRLVSRAAGEHMMPGKDDPRRGTIVLPKFLNGDSLRRGVSDHDRRQALADAIARPDNFWFAAAFVNRTWGELMGQAFSQPVDDMGPGRDVVMPEVLKRLAASFRAEKCDIKGLYRLICNSRTYQRRIAAGGSPDEHLNFAAAYPSRLPAEALWESVANVFGRLNFPAMRSPAALTIAAMNGGRAVPLPYLFVNEFRFDPSLKSDEVEGSIPQALLMMNHPGLNQRIVARPGSVVATLLERYPKDDDAIRNLYLKTLARRPTPHEHATAVAHIKKVAKRAEAFEDLLWALINSTEFQTRR
jgi:hypothetical protein